MTVCNAIENCFVVPSNYGNEVVILTDKDMNYGIMNINDDTLALAGDAVKLLNEAFFVNYPSKISQLNPTGSSEIANFIEDMSSQRLIGLSQKSLSIESSITYGVNEGDIINNNPVNGALSPNPITAQYEGCVTCIKIGVVYIYIYFSCTSLLEINCEEEAIEGYNGVLDFGRFGTTIIPTPASSALGANCSVCGLCNGCRACAACTLCGSINYGVAAIALVAVDSALSVTSATSTFLMNRP